MQYVRQFPTVDFQYASASANRPGETNNNKTISRELSCRFAHAQIFEPPSNEPPQPTAARCRGARVLVFKKYQISTLLPSVSFPVAPRGCIFISQCVARSQRHFLHFLRLLRFQNSGSAIFNSFSFQSRKTFARPNSFTHSVSADRFAIIHQASPPQVFFINANVVQPTSCTTLYHN